MANIMIYLVVFLSQIGNAFFRGWNIRSISDHNLINARFSWFLFGCTHLISISLGVRSFMNEDWVGVSVWFLGSMIGQEISMKLWKRKK
jgi:hypothetical protein